MTPNQKVKIYYDKVDLSQKPYLVLPGCEHVLIPFREATEYAEKKLSSKEWLKYLIPELTSVQTIIEVEEHHSIKDNAMKELKTPQFEARVYNTPNNDTYISLSWRRNNKLLSDKVKFEKSVQTKHVLLKDGKQYIVSFDSQRKKKIKVSLFNDFQIKPCTVTLKEKENSLSL